MKTMPENTWYPVLPLGTILAWIKGPENSEEGTYLLMEDEADLIIAELNGWPLYKAIVISDSTGKEMATWGKKGSPQWP